jgi:formamidopyrimidine-DNA glycosylase
MPELPEVEMVARSLDGIVRGKVVRTAVLLRERLAPSITPSNFSRHLKGRSINFVHRRGKHILIDLSGDKTLIVHLRMSGRFSLLTGEDEDPKFTHAVFHFRDDSRLVFHDQRHFGFMNVVETSQLHQANEIKKLAPEPFAEEFTVEYLQKALGTSRRTVKEFLLDQTKVCGLGNIYAAEALFGAGIHPATLAYRVSNRKVAPLYSAIRDVFRLAIAQAEGLPVDPADLEGSYFSGTGGSWMVYDREHEPCRNCETPIVRLKQGGRSTYFCRKCQRKRA